MLYTTIMAGGAGTRFWPASRRSIPKQLLTLAGERSMIQSTVDRLKGLCPPENMLILTNQSLVESIAAQLPAIPGGSIIGEPAKRDTAPCIALAASLIAARDADATMVVMPADHVIQPYAIFQQAIQSAVKLVDQDPDRIVTFGIKPTYPAEIFGYIERGPREIAETPFPTYQVLRFREKPDAQTAAQFIAARSFYWNSGIFVWKARTILRALDQFAPQIAAPITTIASRIGKSDYDEVLNREFTAIQGISIDFAVMERYNNVLVIEAPFEWDDLGNWSALPRLIGHDENGNTVDAKHIGIQTENTIIKSDDRGHLIVTVGLKNCIVVHTPDATLIADRNHENEIRQIVKQLEANKWNEYL